MKTGWKNNEKLCLEFEVWDWAKLHCLLMFCSGLYINYVRWYGLDAQMTNTQKIRIRLDELQRLQCSRAINRFERGDWLAIVKLSTSLQYPHWNCVSKCVKIDRKDFISSLQMAFVVLGVLFFLSLFLFLSAFLLFLSIFFLLFLLFTFRVVFFHLIP